MNETTTPELGILSVDSDGRVLFWSSLPVVLDTVAVDLGGGVAVLVDPACPERVLSWSIDPDGSAAILEEATGRVGLERELHQRQPGYADAFPILTLQPGWVRLTIAECVSRWRLQATDENILDLDVAAALSQVGQFGGARTLFDCADATLASMARSAVSGVPGGALRELADIAAIGRRVGSDSASEAAECAEGVLTASSPAIPDHWEPASLASHYGAEGALTDYRLVDPLAVPARVLKWHGAAAREIRVFGSETSVTISADLSPGIDPDGPEVRSLRAVSADSATGAILTVVPLRGVGDHVTAELPIGSRNVDDVTVAIVDRTTPLRSLRLTVDDDDEIQADRWGIEGWNLYRHSLAIAGAAGVEDDLVAVEAHSLAFREAAVRALGNAVRLLGESPRARVVQAFRDRVALPVTQDLRPLLAEIWPARNDM